MGRMERLFCCRTVSFLDGCLLREDVFMVNDSYLRNSFGCRITQHNTLPEPNGHHLEKMVKTDGVEIRKSTQKHLRLEVERHPGGSGLTVVLQCPR
jgi:hypothetical protein